MLTGSAKVHRTPPPLSSLDEHLPKRSTSTIAASAAALRSASEHASDAPATPPPMIRVWIWCMRAKLRFGGSTRWSDLKSCASGGNRIVAPPHPNLLPEGEGTRGGVTASAG